MDNSVITRNHQTSMTKEDLDHTIDMLRSLPDLDNAAAVSQLHDVLDLTARGYDPHTIAESLNMSRTELSETIREIGRKFRARQDDAPEAYGTMLFPTEPDPEVLETLSPYRRKKALAEAERQREANPLPLSWQLEFPEVSVRKAVAALRSKTEVDQDMNVVALRVAAAQCAPPSTLVSFPTLRATWRMIQLGQLPRLASTPDLPVRTAQTVVASYDALEAAREDSVAALNRLLEDPDPEELDTLTVRARPLAEAAVTRLEHILEHTRNTEGLEDFQSRGMRRFVGELAGLRLPTHVGELNEGQVLRIALALGLQPEPSIDANYTVAEDRLIELGLAEDLTWIKGIWISAFSSNREDDFWEAIDRLVDGDTNWTDSLM